MSDEPDPKPPGWLRLVLLAWLVHVGLGAGVVTRLLAIGHWEWTFKDYNLRLPWLTQQVLLTQRALGLPGTRAEMSDVAAWVLGGLALFDLAMLASLAAHLRPLWKWWFWGVVVALLLAMLVVEAALALPMWKLREALSR